VLDNLFTEKAGEPEKMEFHPKITLKNLMR